MGRVTGIVLTCILVATGADSAAAAVGEGQGPSAAKAPQVRGALGLKRFDTDQDQAVTVDEFLKRRVEAFTKRDKNGDGVLDAAELGQAPLGLRQQRQEQRMQRLLARRDTNGDGKLTRVEFESSSADAVDDRRSRSADKQKLLFAFYDRNTDGTVDKAEYEAGRLEEVEFAKRRRMHALDRNGDQKVTLEEYTADARFRFMRLDLDRDGRITAADIPPAERQAWLQR